MSGTPKPDSEQDRTDETSADSFPASDPPSRTPTTGPGQPNRRDPGRHSNDADEAPADHR